MPLERAFYLRAAPQVARDLLGCLLVARKGQILTAGRIVETEAYLGPEDGASHAAFRPGSHALFYGVGGFAYVYQAYGLHHCLNAIADRAGRPGCVLIRALEPVEGAAVMARRRRLPVNSPHLASGPGNLARALGVTRRHNGIDLTAGSLVIEPGTARAPVVNGPRIGITRAIHLPLRFWIASSPYVTGNRRY